MLGPPLIILDVLRAFGRRGEPLRLCEAHGLPLPKEEEGACSPTKGAVGSDPTSGFRLGRAIRRRASLPKRVIFSFVYEELSRVTHVVTAWRGRSEQLPRGQFVD